MTYVYHESTNCKKAAETLAKLEPGDILLCKNTHEPPTLEENRTQYLIHQATQSRYFHVGIHIGDDQVLEMGLSGVEVNDLEDFLFRCRFCFVSRNELFWQGGKVDKLEDFVDEMMNEEVEYDLMLAYQMLRRSGAKLPWEVKLPIWGSLPAIWFQHRFKPKQRMICSQLAAEAFHYAGLFSNEAAKLFDTRLMPHELVNDMAYGLPLGYISADSGFKPETHDELYHFM